MSDTQNDCTYQCFYKRKSIIITAPTSFRAQQEAARIFKAKKSWEVAVALLSKDGEAVVHTPDF